MKSPSKRLAAAALATVLGVTFFEAPTAARERSGASQARPPKTAKAHRQAVAHRAPYAIPASAYPGPSSMVPYGGPGRAQFEPLTVGAAPDRGDNHSPEGP
jgi:hypothetical protein